MKIKLAILSLLAIGTAHAGPQVAFFFGGGGGGCYRPQPVVCQPVYVCRPVTVWNAYPVVYQSGYYRNAPYPSITCGSNVRVAAPVYRVTAPARVVQPQTSFGWRR